MNTNYNNNYNDNKKNGRKPFNKRPSNIDIVAPLLIDGHSGRRDYDIDQIKDLLNLMVEREVFNMVGVPVYTPNSCIYNDVQKKGNRVIGYIEGINIATTPDGESSYVVNAKIYPTYENVYNTIMEENGVFHLRLNVNNGAMKVTQFEIAPEDYYS